MASPKKLTAKRPGIEPADKILSGSSDSLERRLGKRIEKAPILSRLRAHLASHLSSRQRLILVGGVLRDLLTPGLPSPKDIDVMVKDVPHEELARLPQARLNFFGGVAFPVGDVWVDLWRVEDTYHIRRLGCPADLPGFLAGAPFNLDKICFSLPEGRLMERGCVEGLRGRIIRYSPKVPYLEEVQAARCILLKRRTGFRLHGSAQELLRRAADSLHQEGPASGSISDYLTQQPVRLDPADIIAEIRACGSTGSGIRRPTRGEVR